MTMTAADTGRRVRSVEGDLGTITSVLEAHGIIYVKFDYQLEQDRPYPTTDLLLEFVENDQQDFGSDLIESMEQAASMETIRTGYGTILVVDGVVTEVTITNYGYDYVDTAHATDAPPELSDRLMAELVALEGQTEPQPVKRGPGRPRKVRT